MQLFVAAITVARPMKPHIPSGSLAQGPLSRKTCAAVSVSLRNYQKHTSANRYDNGEQGEQWYTKPNERFRFLDRRELRRYYGISHFTTTFPAGLSDLYVPSTEATLAYGPT
eukprot:6185723-Pleurochrysis_carterae.AAC.2